MTPTNDAPATVEPAAELAEMLLVGTETGAFDHTPEEIGLHVMENAQAILNALASAPAPSWSETPEHIRDHLALLAEVELHLQSSRVFVTTREKMHPCGVELHDELLGKVTAAIETIGKGQAHG